MLQGVEQRLYVALEHGVQRNQSRDTGKCYTAVETIARWQPAQPQIEDELQDQAEPEHWQGHPQRGEDASKQVDPAAAPGGRDHPQGHADGDDGERSPKRQFQRGRKIIAKIVSNGPLGDNGGPKISMCQITQVNKVLLRQRLIQPQTTFG